MPPRRSPRARPPRSFRLADTVFEALRTCADRTGETASRLAERYIAEGLRMDEHPLITFRTGAAGRRAVLVGTRLDVWQVIETLRASDGVPAAAAEYLEVSEAAVRAAARYYGAYPDEIDDFTARAHEIAEREEELWRGEQAIMA